MSDNDKEDSKNDNDNNTNNNGSDNEFARMVGDMGNSNNQFIGFNFIMGNNISDTYDNFHGGTSGSDNDNNNSDISDTYDNFHGGTSASSNDTHLLPAYLNDTSDTNDNFHGGTSASSNDTYDTNDNFHAGTSASDNAVDPTAPTLSDIEDSTAMNADGRKTRYGKYSLVGVNYEVRKTNLY